MTFPIIVAAAAVITFFAYRLLYGTDTPRIKSLPEVPGLPLFGSLLELGNNHAKVAQGWAKKYGPVFQVRMGNRVSQSPYSMRDPHEGPLRDNRSDQSAENCLRQYF